MKMKYVLFSLLFTLGAVHQVQAGDECKNPKTPYDHTYCISKLFMESDKELNVTYKELRGQLTKPLQAKLKSVQLEWMKYRDAKCAEADNESEGDIIDVNCNYEVNRSRITFLQDRSRECKTGHCRADLLEEKSWEKDQ